MLIQSPEQSERQAQRDALKPRLQGTNISEETFLATDYLNHFNEVIMTLDMAKSVPEVVLDLLDWEPIDYEQHFRESSFTHKDLAVEAYRKAPEETRRLFDRHTNTLAALIRETIDTLALDENNIPDELDAERRQFLSDNVARMQVLIGKLNAVVHGDDPTPDLESEGGESVGPHVSQDEIDALFD